MIDLQSDPDDNNVLHQAAMLAPYEEDNKKSNAASWLHAEVMRFKKVESLLHPMYKEAKNKNGETPMMVFKREHEELRKHAEMLIIRKAKVNIIAAVLIVVIIIATLIKYIIENDIMTFLETKVLLFTMWGAFINLTANTSYVMFIFIITSPFEVEDFELLPSRVNRARTMMLFSLISLLVACGVLLLISLPQQLFLMFARVLPGIVAFSFIPACWFMWSKLKILLFQKERVKIRGGAMYKLVEGHDPNHVLESISTM